MSNNKEKTPVLVLSLDEQRAMVKDEVARFAELAKAKGFVTVAEIDELLPQEMNAAPVLDQLMNSLEVAGIVINEHSAKDSSEAAALTGGADDEDEEEASEEDVKGNDPVRLYLRKMGSVSLLTREGEVEIAKRIEQGERQIVRAILRKDTNLSG